MNLSAFEHYYPEVAAGGFTRVDGTIESYNRINALLRLDMIVVDFSTGRGARHLDNPDIYRSNG